MKNHKKNRRQRIAEKAARLAPAEAKAAGHAATTAPRVSQTPSSAGTIAEAGQVETFNRRLPTSALDEEFDGHKWFGCRPVLVVIVGMSVAFIAWIAYLISLQPPELK